MSRIILCLFLLAGLLLVSAPPRSCAAQEQPESKLAMLAALDFLELCDRGDYLAAWNQTAQLFRENSEKDDWQQEIGHLRRQYGAIEQRKLLYSKPLPEAESAGQTMQLLLFRSHYALKSAVELLTMIREDQGWRVVGYSIE